MSVFRSQFFRVNTASEDAALKRAQESLAPFPGVNCAIFKNEQVMFWGPEEQSLSTTIPINDVLTQDIPVLQKRLRETFGAKPMSLRGTWEQVEQHWGEWPQLYRLLSAIVDELDPTPERLEELRQESESEYIGYMVDAAEKDASNRALLGMLRDATSAFNDILAHIGVTWEPVTDFPTARDAILSRLSELETALDIQQKKC